MLMTDELLNVGFLLCYTLVFLEDLILKKIICLACILWFRVAGN